MGNNKVILFFLLLGFLIIPSCKKVEKVMSVLTVDVTNITNNAAEASGEVIDIGDEASQCGHCYAKTPNVNIDGPKTQLGAPTGPGGFKSSLKNLEIGTKYYIKAYMSNVNETVYGKEISFTTDTAIAIEIGQSYQGGVIAYVLQPGDPGYDANVLHGLIAAPSDQSNGIEWYKGSYIITGATGRAIGTGNANTNAIVAAQGAGSYAAKLCYDLVLGGFNDWYFPSKDELNKLFLNKAAIGDFANNYYWSSSEFTTDYSYAWT